MTNYIAKLQVEVVMNWFYVNVLTKHPLATCLEQHMVSCVCWVSQYCNWTCNWYFTIPFKQLRTFCSALQITSVVVKWNYNYKLVCLKTCNHYVVITFGFSITTTLMRSNKMHACVAALKWCRALLLPVLESQACGLGLPDVAEWPNQPMKFNFPKRQFGKTKIVNRSFPSRNDDLLFS